MGVDKTFEGHIGYRTGHKNLVSLCPIDAPLMLSRFSATSQRISIDGPLSKLRCRCSLRRSFTGYFDAWKALKPSGFFWPDCSRIKTL